jgi:hypothetical protein
LYNSDEHEKAEDVELLLPILEVCVDEVRQ